MRSSRLRSLAISENGSLPSIVSLPHVVELDHIDTAHLSFRDWPTDLNLSSVRHVTLTNNLVALKDFSSFPASLRSIQIQLHPRMPNCVSSNWSILHSLPYLRRLTSLHIVFNDVDTGLDNITYQMMAEIASILTHFGICFRRSSGMPSSAGVDPAVPVEPPPFPQYLFDDPENDIIFDAEWEENDYDDCFLKSMFETYQASIEELRRCIVRATFSSDPLIVVEEGGCGLTVWV
jgi:hypothetical protein